MYILHLKSGWVELSDFDLICAMGGRVHRRKVLIKPCTEDVLSSAASQPAPPNYSKGFLMDVIALILGMPQPTAGGIDSMHMCIIQPFSIKHPTQRKYYVCT